MSQNCSGYILDAYIENNEAVIWIKSEEGKAIRLTDDYEPSTYILPKNEKAGEEIIRILSDLPVVSDIRWEKKITSIVDPFKKSVVCVSSPTIVHYNSLMKVLRYGELRERIDSTFNRSLSHIQQYLFTRLKAKPSSRISFESENTILKSVTQLEDVKIDSPFSAIEVEVVPSTDDAILDSDDPVLSIRSKNEDVGLTSDNKDESVILQDFFNYFHKIDPDVVIFKNADANVLSYLLCRIKSLSLNLQMGRRKIDMYGQDQKYLLHRWTQGRIYISSRQLGQAGVAGIIELSKFSHLPIPQVLKCSINKLIAIRNCYELLERGYVIPDNFERSHEKIRSLEEIIDRDKGGMIISPKVGLHENVAVLDFNDEFANIILNNNISFETANLELQADRSYRILPTIVKQLLALRCCFREVLNNLDQDTKEYESCRERYDAVKKILVCLYGTSGSYWNKYGNVLAFEEINRRSREILLKTKDIVQGLGFKLVYGDTDAIFVHKKYATRADYERLKQTISLETGLTISLQYHYKFLVLLPLEADEKLEALKHYYGITHEGELVMRGIETRRHDTPNFIKEFQKELLCTLFDCDTCDQIISKTLEWSLLSVTKTIDKIMTGEVNAEDLVISKKLRMGVTTYKYIFPHVAAAIQQSIQNKQGPKRGDNIQYIYTDSQHQNSLNRVVAVQGDTDHIVYDREKYREMLLDAAETLLGIFGFDRTVYGKPKDKKWWQELKESKLRDVSAELISNES